MSPYSVVHSNWKTVSRQEIPCSLRIWQFQSWSGGQDSSWESGKGGLDQSSGTFPVQGPDCSVIRLVHRWSYISCSMPWLFSHAVSSQLKLKCWANWKNTLQRVQRRVAQITHCFSIRVYQMMTMLLSKVFITKRSLHRGWSPNQ